MVPLLDPPPDVPPPPQATVAKTAATGSASALNLLNLIWFPLSRSLEIRRQIGRRVCPSPSSRRSIMVPVGARVRRRGPRPHWVADPLLRRKVCAGRPAVSSGGSDRRSRDPYTQASTPSHLLERAPLKTPTGEHVKPRSQYVEDAIRLAMESKWDEAVEINQFI